MKRKMTAMFLCILMVLSFLPVTALAADTNSDGYNDHDYDAIRSFLETEVDGVKNGTRVATAYNADDPTTWEVSFVTSVVDGEKHAYGINWNDKGLSGVLDVSDFTKLSALYLNSNSLTGLNVTNDAELGQIYISDNQITSLNLSTNSGLAYLYCNNNALTSLDTTGAGGSLWEIQCYGNDLTSITVTANTALERLNCSENNLTSLNVSGLSALNTLACDFNALTTLNLTGCSALTYLYCYTNALTSLSLNACTKLEVLSCDTNQLTSLDLSTLTTLTSFSCTENPLTTLKLGANISSLDCSKCGLTTLDLSALTALSDLTCTNNNLTALDLSHNTVLGELDCDDNDLSALDLSLNTSLYRFECVNNNLTSLDLSHNPLLEVLCCNENHISTLDLTNNTVLEELQCGGNRIGALDLTKNTAIELIEINGNPLKQIDASVNSATISLTAKDGGYAELYYDAYGPSLYATAVPVSPAVFYNWTQGATPAAATAKYDLPLSTAIDLDANFLLLTGSPADGKIKCGSSITLTPSIAGGTWSFDSSCLSRSSNVFTGLKEGATTATYTMGDKSVSFNVTVSAKAAPPSLTLTATPSDGKIVVGKSALITPSIPSGTWAFDSAFLSLSGNTFTGLKAGTTRVTYTTADQSAGFDITISQNAVGLSCTKTDASVYGGANGSITVTATGGDSGAYEYSLNSGAWQSANVFSGLAAGTYTAAVRDAANTMNSATCSVTLGQPLSTGNIPAKKIPSKAVAGTALTIVPPSAPRGYAFVSVTYSSSNPSVATVDAAGNVTFLAGGKAAIITKSVYQMTDSKGKIKTKTTTVKKTVTVKQPVASVSLNLIDTTIIRTQKVKLTASIAPSTASSKKVTWTSSNKKVATVSSTGVVTGKLAGTAVITCTAKDGSGAAASCNVSVTPVNPTGLKLSKSVLTVKTGKTTSLKATVLPRNTDFKTVSWASSNSAIATVDAKGKIKGIAPGTTTVTAITSNGMRVFCTVTVK